MILLRVWITLPDGSMQPIGALACGDADRQGHYNSEFQYLPSWLQHREAFPIDPVHLELGGEVYAAKQLHPPLSVLEDALPDDWGRDLLVLAHRFGRDERTAPNLLRALGADGLGALSFGTQMQPRPSTGPAASKELPALMQAALDFDAGRALESDALRLLFAAGSSPGGARPKALVHDGRGQWIAKFPSQSRDAGKDVVGLEAVCMRMAVKAGLEVPTTELLQVRRRKVLLVKRFDVTPGGGRYHMISLKSLWGERPGVHALGYSDLAAVVRKVSAEPLKDVTRLYRQMIFNAAIGNTDDHLKNFWMLREPRGYCLSPAFDLVPDVAGNRHHLLQFQYDTAPPTRAVALAIAKAWGVREAGDIIDQVTQATTAFRRLATALRVAKPSVEAIDVDMQARRRQLRATN